MLISCKHCGKPVSDHAKFCPHCGSAVSDKAVNQEPEPESITEPEPEQEYEPHYVDDDSERNGSRKWWFAALLLVVGAAVAGGWFYHDNIKEQERIAALEKARQDSIAAAEKARQDSIAAEKARQDSIAKWDFFTADEIIDISFELTTANTLRSICKRHGMSILYEDEYYDQTYTDQIDKHIELAAGKGCELSRSNRDGYNHRSLKASSDVAFGILLSGTDFGSRGEFSVSVQECSSAIFAFPTKEAREGVIKGLKAKGLLPWGSDCGPDNLCYECWEENGLYWLRLAYPV